jgi:Protein of unknown function, DUF547
MSNLKSCRPLSTTQISRRSLVASLVLGLSVAACAKPAKIADKSWTKSGDESKQIDHNIWDALLAKYVRPAKDGLNRVAYADMKRADAATLKDYIATMQAVPISNYSRNEQFAFWVNLYNAVTVDVILDNYPIESIRKIGSLGQGPWGKKLVTVEGKKLSLDDMEHGILRPIWKDVRIHYAVNCASIGCPNLAPQAYRADRLEAMLDQAASDYINHPRAFTAKDGKITASSIFDWYQDDWGNASAVLTHARKYAKGDTVTMLSDAKAISGYDYNWSLNDIV